MEVVEISADGKTGRARYMGSEFEIRMSLVAAVPGDYVLVHAGCAISEIKKSEAEEIEMILKLLEETANEP